MLKADLRRLLSIDLSPPSAKALKAYAAVVAWIWQDGVWRSRTRMPGFLLYSGAAILCQIGAFNILFGYANALEHDRSVSAFGMELATRSSALLLVAAAIGSFSLLSAYGYVVYHSGLRLIDWRREYEEFCQKRFVLLASQLPHPSMPTASRMLAEGTLERMARSGPRGCGRVLQLLLTMLLPAARLLACVVVMVFVSALFSLIVAALLAVGLLFLHRVNRAAAETSRAYAHHGPRAEATRRRLLERTWRSPAPIADSDRAANEALSGGEVASALDAYFRRYVHAEESALVINGLTAVALLTVALAGGTGVLSGAWSWSVFLLYLLALRFFMTSLMQVGRGLTRASRFYPQVFEHYQMVTEAERATRSSLDSVDREPVVALALPSLEGEAERLELRPGAVTYLIHPGPLDARLVHLLQTRTDGAASNGTPYWFVGEAAHAGSTLRQFYGFPEGLADAKLQSELASLLGWRDEPECTGVGLDEVLSEARLELLPASLHRALGLLAGVHSGRPVILVREDDLRFLLDASGKLPASLSSYAVLAVCASKPRLSNAGLDSPILLYDGRELIGWCSPTWLEAHPEVLPGPMNGRGSRDELTSAADGDEQEVDDEEL